MRGKVVEAATAMGLSSSDVFDCQMRRMGNDKPI